MADSIGGPYALVPRDELADTVIAFNKSHTQVGMWALEALRVAQGRARLLFEVDHKSIPNELGFLNKAVHMQKGCYRGQETVAKVFNLGQPPRKLVLLHLDGSMVAMPENSAKLFHNEKEVGYIGTLARHYEEHVGKGFYADLVAFMSRNPVVALVLEGPEDTWEIVRAMMGATNPRSAAPGTIRGDLGTLFTENLVHGSDSAESAAREIQIFFPGL
jgi:folate-binding protein YgfZ